MQRKDGTLDIRFAVTDRIRQVPVHYVGILPDMFKEGTSIIATGRMDGGRFVATEVLAKHDETYMPREVADALKKQGHWKDDYGTKPNASAAAQPTQGAKQ